MDKLRAKFVKQFGEDTATAIEEAAAEHSGFMVSDVDGTFKRALCLAIGFECMSEDTYRKYHGITEPWDNLSKWIRDNAGLTMADVSEADPLAAACGQFDGLLQGEA